MVDPSSLTRGVGSPEMRNNELWFSTSWDMFEVVAYTEGDGVSQRFHHHHRSFVPRVEKAQQGRVGLRRFGSRLIQPFCCYTGIGYLKGTNFRRDKLSRSLLGPKLTLPSINFLRE